MRSLSTLAVLAFIGVGPLDGQEAWVPITADYRSVNSTIQPDGAEVVTKELRGTFLRSSIGSELLTKYVFREGRTVEPVNGLFRDAAKGEVFMINFGPKTAILQQTFSVPRRHKFSARDWGASFKEDLINGLTCKALPIKGEDGAIWVSVPYDMWVRIDSRHSDGAYTYHHVEDIYNISLGAEPPASELRLPDGFSVVRSLKDVPLTGSCKNCPNR